VYGWHCSGDPHDSLDSGSGSASGRDGFTKCHGGLPCRRPRSLRGPGPGPSRRPTRAGTGLRGLRAHGREGTGPPAGEGHRALRPHPLCRPPPRRRGAPHRSRCSSRHQQRPPRRKLPGRRLDHGRDQTARAHLEAGEVSRRVGELGGMYASVPDVGAGFSPQSSVSTCFNSKTICSSLRPFLGISASLAGLPLDALQGPKFT